MTSSLSRSSRGSLSFSIGDELSSQRISSPFIRQESVVENLERKQRENLKNRLKLLTTLPSRSTSKATPMPVIARAPSGKVSLPKVAPRLTRYTSVLSLSSDRPLETGQKSNLVRRHSVGCLVYECEEEGKANGRSGGKNFRSGFWDQEFSTSRKLQTPKTKYKGEQNDFMDYTPKPMSEIEGQELEDALSKVTLRQKRDVGYNQTTVLPSKGNLETYRQKISSDANKSGSSQSLSSSSSQIQNLKSVFERKTPEISNKISNGSSEQTNQIKTDSLISTTVNLPPKQEEDAFKWNGLHGKSKSLSNGYAIKSHMGNNENNNCDEFDDVFCELDSTKDVRAEIKNPDEFTGELLIQFDEPPSHIQQNQPVEINLDSDGAYQKLPNNIHPSKDFECLQELKTETDDLMCFDLPTEKALKNPLGNDYDTSSILKDEVKLCSDSSFPKVELIGLHNSEKTTNSTENILTASPQSTDSPRKDVIVSEENKDTVIVTDEGKNDKEIESTEQKTVQKLESSDEKLMPNCVLESVSKCSSVLVTNNGGSFDKTGKSLDSLEVKSSGEQILNELNEPNSTVDPNANNLEVEISKSSDFGLGFCIEGGKGHPEGDKPITVKRVFKEHPSSSKQLMVGDELLVAANQDMTSMSHLHAWKFLRSLPEGDVKMKIIRRTN